MRNGMRNSKGGGEWDGIEVNWLSSAGMEGG